MDRPTNRMDADARIKRNELPAAESFLPPSREALLNLASTALKLGPVLLTGDAGIGKTWMVGRLIERSRNTCWHSVDLTPSDGSSDLYRQLVRSLGISSTSVTRIDLLDVLAERSLDGERHSLVIDEAQNLSPSVWEEVRVLCNRFGQEDGFEQLILVGQTPLVRRFATRAMAAVESRLAAHLHLRPLDVAEASDWLEYRHPNLNWSSTEVEAVHRDSGGNPARLLRRSVALAARLTPNFATAPISGALEPASKPEPAPLEIETDLDGFGRTAMISNRSPLVETSDRPPLHVEENSIEVGWSSDDPEPAVEEDPADQANEFGPSSARTRVEDSDQAVHDHYAALQAWREWADNQERRNHPAKSDRDLADEIDDASEAEAADPPALPVRDRGSIRSEGYQQFAPFGQLFTKLSQVREPESPRP